MTETSKIIDSLMSLGLSEQEAIKTAKEIALNSIVLNQDNEEKNIFKKVIWLFLFAIPCVFAGYFWAMRAYEVGLFK